MRRLIAGHRRGAPDALFGNGPPPNSGGDRIVSRETSGNAHSSIERLLSTGCVSIGSLAHSSTYIDQLPIGRLQDRV